MIHHGDLFDVLPTLEPDSIDACVTDPPYDLTNRTPDVGGCESCGRTLGGRDGNPDVCPRCGGALTRQRSKQGRGFMGKEWDGTGVAFNPETWQQVYRVLKPGAHLLAFGGTRTFHRMTCAIEDAGFEIRDCLSWLYGQGFPKSLDVSKALDKAAGSEREIVGVNKSAAAKANKIRRGVNPFDVSMADGVFSHPESIGTITAPSTDLAKQWSGWGTALKPAWEPIILARKPLIGTVAQNVAQHCTGAINVDATRIGTEIIKTLMSGRSGGNWNGNCGLTGHGENSHAGRWPANVVLDDQSARLLDEQTGELMSGAFRDVIQQPRDAKSKGREALRIRADRCGDRGGASRFFMVAAPDCVLCGMVSVRRDTMNECESTSANGAASPSRTIHQIIGATVLSPAHVSLAEQIAQAAPYVESLCERCATSIVLALVEIKSSGSNSQESRAFLGSMPDSKSSILIQNLACFAELWASTDTIPTTASLSLLFGSVLHAIGSCTKPASPKGASDQTRFLYSAKPSREERDYGCEGLTARTNCDISGRSEAGAGLKSPRDGALRTSGGRNSHPTVKPVELMRWLVKLVTPPDGTVLDPFTGSGTTGMACRYEHRQFIGIEREAEYVAIAEARISAVAPLFTDKAKA